MVIILTEEQLKEATGISFEYLDGEDEKPFSGQSEISVSGNPGVYKDIEIKPKDSNAISRTVTRPGFQWFATLRGPTMGGMLNCGEEKGGNDRVDDFYDTSTGPLNTLTDGDKGDDMSYIPNSVLEKIDGLIKQMKADDLNGTRCSIVISKLAKAIKNPDASYGDIEDNSDMQEKAANIPNTVIRRLYILADNMRNLSEDQKAAVMNRILEETDFNNIPYRNRRKLRKKVGSIPASRKHKNFGKELNLEIN